MKLFSCINPAEHKFQLLNKAKMLKINDFRDVKVLVCAFILLIDVKMPSIIYNCWHFNHYEQDKFRAKLS